MNHDSITTASPVIGILILLTSVIAPQHLSATENRCGWYSNPTPANYWLDDADNSWTLSIQGDFHADNFFDLPASNFDFGDQWISRGPTSYGYGCACVKGDFNHETSEAIRVESVKPLPLDRCYADPNLLSEPN